MPIARKARTADTYNLEARLEALIDIHLSDMEENPQMYASRDRLATIQYVGAFLNRKFGWGEPEAAGVGSAVKRYAGAFRVSKTANRPARVSGGLAAISGHSDEEDAA